MSNYYKSLGFFTLLHSSNKVHCFLQQEPKEIFFLFTQQTSMHGHCKTNKVKSCNFLTLIYPGVNEAPTNISLTNGQIAENSKLGTTIGYFSTVDPDKQTKFTYSLFPSSQSSKFKIVNNVLVLNGAIDYEMEDEYTLVVTSTDPGGLSITKPFDVFVTGELRGFQLNRQKER